MKRIYLIALIGLTTAILPLSAHDFSVRLKGDNTLYFSILDTVKHTIAVTAAVKYPGIKTEKPSNRLDIPGIVQHRDTVWYVTTINAKAFANSDQLTFVSLPSSVESIGDAAFSGCSSLMGIIFPARQISISKDAFMGCKAIANISFGTDWTEIDLNLFQDSDSLRMVRVPARVRKLTNLKSLTALETVEVDPNNSVFHSRDGLLYSADQQTLFACPRGRSGEVIVPEETVSILDGAFADCSLLESISLPSSLQKVSYLEFSRCTLLKSLTLHAKKPITTARREGVPVFAIRMPSSKMVLFVPSETFSLYQKVICTEAGHYENMDGRQNEYFQEVGFVSKKSIKRIK